MRCTGGGKKELAVCTETMSWWSERTSFFFEKRFDSFSARLYKVLLIAEIKTLGQCHILSAPHKHAEAGTVGWGEGMH